MADEQPQSVKIDKEAAQPGQSYDRYKKAFELLSIDDVNRIENMPCMRNALLYGIGGGMTFGAIHFISTRSTWSICFANTQLTTHRDKEQLELDVRERDGRHGGNLAALSVETR